MSLRSATALLLTASIRNRIRRQVQRLRKPQYLAGTIIGGLYLWQMVVRRMFMAGRLNGSAGLDARMLPLVETPLVALGLLLVLGAWILGGERAQLRFTEAEIQFLFTGPVSRRQLLHYRLARSLARTAFSALLSTLFVGRVLSHRPLLFAAGAWFGMSTLALHFTGASLTRESLATHGRFGLRRRLVVLAVGGAALAALVAWTLSAVKPPPPDSLTFESAADWLDALTHSAPLAWVLAPIRAPIRLALAPTVPAFLAALPGAAGVLALHYAWVIAGDVAFEEAAVDAAEDRAKRAELRRAGDGRRPISVRAKKFRLPLGVRGRPEVAVLWKNLIAARRTLGFSLLAALLAVAIPGGVLGMELLGAKDAVVPAVVGCGSAALALFLIVLGPSLFRTDLRLDLPQMDVLRALPMSGAQVVRGELLSPGLLIACAQWFLLALAFVLTARFPIEELPLGLRAAALASLGFLGPAFSLAGLTVQNAAVLLFPAWVVVDRQQARGVEAIGQRLLTTAGSMVVLIVAVIPAALAGGLVALALWGLLGPYGVPVACAAAAAVIVAEVALATQLMGRLFERFDVTD